MSEKQNIRRVAIGAYSAYAIAVKHGYTGTEEEWIREVEADRVRAEAAAEKAEASVQNAVQKAIDEGLFKGDKGDPGEKGEKGDKGDKGADAVSYRWELLEQLTTAEDCTLFERTGYELKGIKVLLRTGARQSKNTFVWTCQLSSGTQLTGSLSCVASSSSTSPPTVTCAQVQVLPCFGHYLALAGAAATGLAPALSLPADLGGAAVSTDSPISSFTLASGSGSVPLRSGAAIEIWGLK